MERHREMLAGALRIITTEGLDALTMQRLAEELQCGVGTLYRFFPSKGVLIAELQRESLDIVSTALHLSQSHIGELLESRGIDDPVTIALTRAVGAARFWIGAETVFPEEIELFRRLFTQPNEAMDETEATRVVPAGLRLLDQARGVLDDAVAAGALHAGPNIERAVVVIAATTGVLLTAALERWDDTIFDARRLSGLLVRDLLIGWGADPERLDPIDDLLATLAELGRLIPDIRR